MRSFVADMWRETNRLNSVEAAAVLKEMFYLAVSLGPMRVAQLTRMWCDLMHTSRTRNRRVFLEPGRLTLLPFDLVFVQSEALQLAICHYVRSPPDEPPVSSLSPKGHAPVHSRGGISREVLDELMELVLVAEFAEEAAVLRADAQHVVVGERRDVEHAVVEHHADR